MWTRDFTQTGSRLALLIAQFVAIVLCIGYIDHFYTTNILPDKQAKEYFQQTTCFLANKQLSTKGRLIHRYRADFLVSYTVNNMQYTHWVSGNGLDISFSRNKVEQENILSPLDVGQNYLCWYNPDNPQIAILVLRHNWLSTFPLMFPSVIAVIVFYYFMKNLFEWMSIVRINTREKREKKK